MNRNSSARPKKAADSRAVMGRVRVSYPKILSLLVPLDFSGKSRQALRYALPIAQKFSSRIALVHVIAEEKPRKEKIRPPSAEELKQERNARERLSGMAEQLLPPAVRGKLYVCRGQPAAEILRIATEADVDMIIIATHGRTGLKRAWRGSTAEVIMRQARCPVLSLRRA